MRKRRAGSPDWCRLRGREMRIAEIKTHVLEAPLSEPFSWSFTSTALRTSCVVEVICEDGTVGWGECFGPAALNAPIVAAFRPHLVGQDALASEQIWMHLYNQFRDQGQRGLSITALSGLDIALWDIKGKHFQAPAHVLLGGPLRRQVRRMRPAPTGAVPPIRRATSSRRSWATCARASRP